MVRTSSSVLVLALGLPLAACVGQIGNVGGDDAGGGDGAGPAVCGDGVVGGSEACDDGNTDDTDGCITCQFATCGDGHVRKHVEACDDGSAACVRCSTCSGVADPVTGHCYTIIAATSARPAAEAACAAAGAHLITLDGAGEWAVVAPLWTAPFADTWIGLTRVTPNQPSWAWEDGTALAAAAATWNPGEPNNQGGVEDCAEATGAGGAWTDLACSQPRAAMCERPTWVFDPATNHAYRPFFALRTQPEAIADCAAIGAHLATVTSAEEQAVVTALAGRDIWIGLFQGPSEGSWFWSTGERYEFKSWAPMQPDDFMANEDCAHLTARTGLWNDRACTTRLPYLCEIN